MVITPLKLSLHNFEFKHRTVKCVVNKILSILSFTINLQNKKSGVKKKSYQPNIKIW